MEIDAGFSAEIGYPRIYPPVYQIWKWNFEVNPRLSARPRPGPRVRDLFVMPISISNPLCGIEKNFCSFSHF